VDEAYPFVAKMLLTDDSPRLRAALKYMVSHLLSCCSCYCVSLDACRLAWVESQLNLHVCSQHIDWRRLVHSPTYMSVTSMMLPLLQNYVIAVHCCWSQVPVYPYFATLIDTCLSARLLQPCSRLVDNSCVTVDFYFQQGLCLLYLVQNSL